MHKAYLIFFMVWSFALMAYEILNLFAGKAWYVHGPAALIQGGAFVLGCWLFDKTFCQNSKVKRYLKWKFRNLFSLRFWTTMGLNIVRFFWRAIKEIGFFLGISITSIMSFIWLGMFARAITFGKLSVITPAERAGLPIMEDFMGTWAAYGILTFFTLVIVLVIIDKVFRLICNIKKEYRSFGVNP